MQMRFEHESDTDVHNFNHYYYWKPENKHFKFCSTHFDERQDTLKSCISTWVFSCRHSLYFSFSLTLTSFLLLSSQSWIYMTQKLSNSLHIWTPLHHSFFHFVSLVSIVTKFSASFEFVNIFPKLLFQCPSVPEGFIEQELTLLWGNLWEKKWNKIKLLS